MKIEFEKVDSELVVREAIIRQCASDMLEKQNLDDCFQGRTGVRPHISRTSMRFRLEPLERVVSR